MPKKHRKHKKSITVKIKTRTIEFAYLSGDVLMTLEDISKEIKWSCIIEKIATEEWYKACKRWKFVFGLKNLDPDDVLDSDEDSIKIICVKIDPQIFFNLPDGELLVSIPFDSCHSWRDGQVYLIGACFEAHKKLIKLGKDGYGTAKTKIHPLVNTYFRGNHEIPNPHSRANPYIYRDENKKEIDLNDVLENSGDENLFIVAYPKEVYCFHLCESKFFHGPLRIGEQRKVIYEKGTVSLCSNCGFLHCPYCGRYLHYNVGTPECRLSRDA
jgi:hypothetical protein